MIVLVALITILVILLFAPQSVVEAFVSIIGLVWVLVVLAIMMVFGLMAIYRLTMGYFG